MTKGWEVVKEPSIGGYYYVNFNHADTMVVIRPDNRYLPSTEVHKSEIKPVELAKFSNCKHPQVEQQARWRGWLLI